jgi:3-dehydroquinate synthase
MPETELLHVDTPFSVSFTHRVRFTADVLDPVNPALRDAAAAGGNTPARLAAFADQGLLDAWPDLPRRLHAYAAAYPSVFAPVDAVHVVPGGERCKNDRGVFDGLCRQIHDAQLCRQSFVLALGGGAVLDAVGFAAAVAHRGIRLIRVPSTTLAQADSGLAVKNGINAFGRKNFLGCFAPPWAVLCDERWLGTLGDADWRSGFSEAVKVAVLKDADFFARLAADAPGIRARDLGVALPALHRCAQIHLHHIVAGGDPFELTHARPLDFGHWSAHKLEQMTGYRLRHGHAVAVGIALDCTYAALLGLFPRPDAQAVVACLAALGLPVFDPALHDGAELWRGAEEFRQHLGGTLCITLPRALGAALDVHQLERAAVLAAVAELAARSARTPVG